MPSLSGAFNDTYTWIGKLGLQHSVRAERHPLLPDFNMAAASPRTRRRRNAGNIDNFPDISLLGAYGGKVLYKAPNKQAVEICVSKNSMPVPHMATAEQVAADSAYCTKNVSLLLPGEDFSIDWLDALFNGSEEAFVAATTQAGAAAAPIELLGAHAAKRQRRQ